MEKTYHTTDLTLAVALILSGHNVKEVRTSQLFGKRDFIFEHTPELRIVLDSYWAGNIRVEPRAFSSEMRNLKTRLHDTPAKHYEVEREG